MIRTIVKLTIALALLTPSAYAATENNMTLDTLLTKVRRDAGATNKINAQREKEFLAKRNQQKKLLAKAKSELRSLEAISAKLMKSYDSNEKVLSKLEGELNIAKGTLGEMFGVVRQVAGDLKGQLENSVVSAQIPGREKFAAKLAESKSLPGIEDLESLWFEMQREMTETGKVAKFKSSVVNTRGEKRDQQITRVGAFNIVADGSYLTYQGETGQIVELGRQPSGRFTGLIEDLEEGDDKFNAFALDPSRGAILGMLVQAPSLFERVQQGGVVGYIILILLAIGLGLSAERYFYLTKSEKKIDAQLTADKVDETNPLGKVMIVFEKYKGLDLESLELKLDEAILKATPSLKRGIGTIKIFSAVAPLLGLLGTVTGMILTFQSITLFGTGDPKLMAGGISQALITTVLGLVCAIPLLLVHNMLANKSNKLVQIIEEQSAGLIAARSEKGAQ